VVAHPAVPAVQAEALTVIVDDRPILNRIDLNLSAGDYVALLGANGAGKSTLLRTLAMLLFPTEGRLELFGRPAHRSAGAAAIRGRIGMIGHQAMLYRDLSVRENLLFFGRLYGVHAVDDRAEQLLEQVGLADRAEDPVKTFSRGMVQRAAIARALMHDPDLLLSDEPFSGLDAPSTLAVEALFATLHAAGKTLVMANHDIAQSLGQAQRVVVLRRGKVALDKRSAEVTSAGVLREVETP
jgi:heme exporter protein A